MLDKIWVRCEKCGKKLLERKSNGNFSFRFGSRPGSPPVVEMEIQGSIRMTCIRRSCRAENTFTFFPPSFEVENK